MDPDVYLYKMPVSQSFNKQTERKINEYPSKCHTFALVNNKVLPQMKWVSINN